MKRSITLPTIILFILALSSCATTNNIENSKPLYPIQRDHYSTLTPFEIQSKLMNQYEKWQGVPYRLGGMTKRGVDCSALMQQIFRNEFDHQLPRTTRQQLKIGKRISRTELYPGDLIFFRISKRVLHVGVYLGENQFIHASESRGVMISNLYNSYWSPRYLSARRPSI